MSQWPITIKHFFLKEMDDIDHGWEEQNLLIIGSHVSQGSCQLPSTLLPSLTWHLNPLLKQQCYFCQVWSDWLCLLMECLVQKLSKFTLSPLPNRGVLTTTGKVLTIHYHPFMMLLMLSFCRGYEYFFHFRRACNAFITLILVQVRFQFCLL